MKFWKDIKNTMNTLKAILGKDCKKLVMDLTLDENDVPDEKDEHFAIYEDDTKNIEI